MDDVPPPQVPVADRHLWQIRWVRDLAFLLLTLLIIWILFTLRPITLPAIVGVGFAYVINPLLEYLRTRWKLPRLASTVAIMSLSLLTLTATLYFVLPPIINQSGLLLERAAKYLHYIREQSQPYLPSWLQATLQAAAGGVAHPAPAAEPSRTAEVAQELSRIDVNAIFQFLSRGADLGLQLLGTTVSLTLWIPFALVVFLFCFFYFSWKFDSITQWCHQFIPHSNRAHTLHILHRMDVAVSAFIRGRLLQSIVMMTNLSVGWWIAGVPYYLLLGILGGLLNMIPYAAFLGWFLAVTLTLVDVLSGGSAFTWAAIIWPTVVYMIAQGLDGWVVEPVVQGRATELDPLTILLVVLAGGSLGGLLGLVLAIPVAACLKIYAQEVIVPRMRHFAETH